MRTRLRQRILVRATDAVLAHRFADARRWLRLSRLLGKA